MSDPPLAGALQLVFADKVAHAAAYAVLGALAWGGAHARRARRPVLLAVTLATAYGVSDELHQAFVPNRHADVLDAVADLCGAVVGALIAAAAARALAARRR
jgi:VanZ family protein